jgi:dephospho-CoA kinase
MLAIPLLVESGGDYAWVDRVLVVDVPRDVQRARLIARDGITGALADSMLDAQASRARRLAVADDVIANDGTLAEHGQRVADLHARYLALAQRISAGATRTR